MLFLVCAHPAEARPLIAEYGLQKHTIEGPFPIYMNRDRNLALVQTGTGKVAAAAACMYTAQTLSATANDAWLNVGIAGHGSRAIGEAVITHKIVDAGNNDCWYPHLTFPVTTATDSCVTVDQPQDDYPEYLCDMEASGIYATATRFTTLEMVHSLKVVSDNRDHPHTHLDRNEASNLIAEAIPGIDELVRNLSSLSREMQQIHQYRDCMPEILDRLHFTSTQSHMLEVLLRRWQCLKPDIDPVQHFQSSRSAKALLNAVQTELDACEISLVTDKS